MLGLGNDILTDDAIGLRVVRQLEPEFHGHPFIDIRETSEMGLALLDFIAGYSKVILVDSVQTTQAPVGSVHEVDAGSLSLLPARTPHFLGVGETLALGRQLGLPMPQEVRVFAIEVHDPYTLGEHMTSHLEEALPAIVERVAQALNE